MTRCALFEQVWLVFLLAAITRALAIPLWSAEWPILAGWLILVAGWAWSVRYRHQAPAGSQNRSYSYYVLAFSFAFPLIGPTVKLSSQWRADQLLQEIDSHLIGTNLSLALTSWITPGLTDIFSAAYMSFIVLLYSCLLYYFCRNKAAQMYPGLFFIYGVGFMGYLMLPAAGPYHAMTSSFAANPLHGGTISALNRLMVQTGSNLVDVFPSLHVAVSAYLGLVLYRDHPTLGKALAPVILLVWLSTIYLRYHYFIDVITGLILALAAYRWAQLPETRP